MNKSFSGACLVASTAIGSGMLALPIILASFGVVNSFLLTIAIWLLTYYTSLVAIELSLQVGEGLSIGRLGRYYSGKYAELIGTLSIKTLSYALLSVFICGISDIIQKMLNSWQLQDLNFQVIAIAVTIAVVVILSLSMKLVDYINRILFYALLASIALIIVGSIAVMDFGKLPPLLTTFSLDAMRVATPILLTSFGYQTIFVFLVRYCENNKDDLERACFWGSLIPAVIYVLWFFVILVVIYANDEVFYNALVMGSVNVGVMIEKLSAITKINYMQVVVWSLSILAIFTSLTGLGIGLVGIWEEILQGRKGTKKVSKKIIAMALTFIPSLIIALVVPNAFVKMLSFAGMILVVIAIFLPLYLLQKAKIEILNYKILKNNLLRLIAALAGVAIVVMEIMNVFYKGI